MLLCGSTDPKRSTAWLAQNRLVEPFRCHLDQQLPQVRGRPMGQATKHDLTALSTVGNHLRQRFWNQNHPPNKYMLWNSTGKNWKNTLVNKSIWKTIKRFLNPKWHGSSWPLVWWPPHWAPARCSREWRTTRTPCHPPGDGRPPSEVGSPKPISPAKHEWAAPCWCRGAWKFLEVPGFGQFYISSFGGLGFFLKMRQNSRRVWKYMKLLTHQGLIRLAHQILINRVFAKYLFNETRRIHQDWKNF